MKEEQGEGYLIRKWVLEKPQKVMGKMTTVQKMWDRFQQVVDRMNWVQKMRQVPAGCWQDKQGAEDVREVQAGCGEDQQDPWRCKVSSSGL